MTMQLLVTGATGFVGAALLQRLSADGAYAVRAAVRNADATVPPGVSRALVPAVAPDAQWLEALTGCDVVVHLAARVHVMHERSKDPLQAYRQTNVQGTGLAAPKL